MAGNNSIQILRGSQTYDPSTSDQVLLDGQPFYSKKNQKLYIGDGETPIKDLIGTQIGLNIESGNGTSTIQQTESDCQTIGDFGVSFGFGGKYVGRSDAPVETYRVLKALSDIDEPVYFEYSTIKWQLALKNKKAECVNLYDTYQDSTIKNRLYVLTNVENETFSAVSITDCYSYAGVNKGKASLTAGTKYYNDAKYSSVFGTQNVVGDNQEQTYNDLVSGSFNIVRSEKNSIIGGKSNNVLNGQLNIIGGTENNVQSATTSIIGGRNNKFINFYNSIGVGYWLEGSGDGKAIFGRTNIYKSNALLIVGNGNEEGRSNAFEVLNDGSATIQRTNGNNTNIVNVAYLSAQIKNLCASVSRSDTDDGFLVGIVQENGKITRGGFSNITKTLTVSNSDGFTCTNTQYSKTFDRVWCSNGNGTLKYNNKVLTANSNSISLNCDSSNGYEILNINKVDGTTCNIGSSSSKCFFNVKATSYLQGTVTLGEVTSHSTTVTGAMTAQYGITITAQGLNITGGGIKVGGDSGTVITSFYKDSDGNIYIY